MKNTVIKIIALSLLALNLGCASSLSSSSSVISISVSDDGKYAVSVNDQKNNQSTPNNGTLILWDIDSRSKKVLSKQANVYSVSFMPNSHQFIWQDNDGVVREQSIDGRVIKEFRNFTTYGQIMADGRFYLASDKDWNLNTLDSTDSTGELKIVKANGAQVGFYASGKVLNLSAAGNYFVTAGFSFGKADVNAFLTPIVPQSKLGEGVPYSSITLWDKVTLQPLTKLLGMSAKTYAKISPDGQWVIGGDENTHLFMWATQPPYEQIELLDTVGGQTSKRTHSTAFLDHGQKFIIIDQSRHSDRKDTSLVYEVGNPQAIGTVDLGLDPKPCVKYYQRNLCTASAPDANILVTGQEDGGGINVYRFHPDTLTMEKIWVAH